MMITVLTATAIVLSKNINSVEAVKINWGTVWKIALRASGRFYNIKPKVSTGKYGQTVTPGTITLNGKKYGASAMFNVKSTSTKHSIALYAKGWVDTLFHKYSLIVINPHGHYTINASITTGVYRGFKFGLKGTYKVLFVANNKYKLAPYIAYRRDSANKIFGTSAIALPGTSSITTTDEAGNKFENVLGYGKLLYPSWGSKTIGNASKQISVSQLYSQLTDNGTAVYSMKSYKAGDKIKISDVITGTQYDSSTDSTKLFFGNVNTYLEYSGNLTNTLKPGMHFDKTMTVEQLGNNAAYRVPDYFKQVLDNDENNYPSYY